MKPPKVSVRRQRRANPQPRPAAGLQERRPAATRPNHGPVSNRSAGRSAAARHTRQGEGRNSRSSNGTLPAQNPTCWDECSTGGDGPRGGLASGAGSGERKAAGRRVCVIGGMYREWVSHIRPSCWSEWFCDSYWFGCEVGVLCDLVPSAPVPLPHWDSRPCTYGSTSVAVVDVITMADVRTGSC